VVRLSLAQYPAAYALYCRHNATFPLIAAVLGNVQDGIVYADSAADPTQVYVEHAFGFAQIFGASAPGFEGELRRHLLVEKAFSSNKVRLYTPFFPDFLRADECIPLCAWRQHFRLDASRVTFEAVDVPQGTVLLHGDLRNIALIESAFGVVRRFWRSDRDFAGSSNAVLALVKGKPAALCYAAAIAEGRAEIDVMALPAYRNLGLAKAAVQMFNQRCLAQDVLPLWDCFTNNAASMALCRATGFVPLGDPYAFLTINR
jgi:RimJ/RimL family protein N-acetyltransferase